MKQFVVTRFLEPQREGKTWTPSMKQAPSTSISW
jgi:hypothetical protein